MLPAPEPAVREIDEQFLDLLLDDQELLRAEFDALIAAAWSGAPPAQPGRTDSSRSRPDQRPRLRPVMRLGGELHRTKVDARPRQRSPPEAGDDQRNPQTRKAGP